MIHQPSSLSGPEEGLLATTQPDPKLTDGSVRSGQFLTDTPLRSPVRPVLEAELLMQQSAQLTIRSRTARIRVR